MSAFDYLVFYKYIPILYTSTNPIVEQISNRIAYTCEHSNFRPVLSSKINSSSSFDDGALLDELFFVGVGLGTALLGDGDGPVISLAGLGDDALLGDGDDAAGTHAEDPASHLLRVAEMAAQVASLEPAVTHVLAVTVEMVGVSALVAAVHDTHAEFVASHLGVAAEMAAQGGSSEPTTTQSLVTVEYLTRLAEMAAQVASLEPTATQVLGVTVDIVGVSADVAAVHDTQTEPAV